MEALLDRLSVKKGTVSQGWSSFLWCLDDLLSTAVAEDGAGVPQASAF